MKKRKNEIDMCNGPLFGKVLIFSLPLMLSGILQLLYNAADVAVVGRFAGSESLAAVGSTGSLINLMTNLFIGMSVGASVVVARNLGAHNFRKAHDSVHTAIAISLIAGAVTLAIGLSLSKVFLALMDTPADVIELATVYMRIYFIGMPGLMVYNFGAAILRAMGDTVRPLIFLTISGIVNVALNLFFVCVFHMDVAGVALATIISQYISAVLVIICLLKLENCCHLSIKEIAFHKEEVTEILKVGLPAGVQSSLFSVSNVLIQSSINSFGSTVMAGNAAASNIEGFTYIAMNSVYQASLTFTSQNVGAKKPERISRVAVVSLFIVTAVGLVLGSLSYAFGETLLKIYSTDAAIIPYGMVRLKYICLPYFLCGVMEIFVGLLRGMNCSTIPMIVSVFGSCVFRVLWVYTAFRAYPTQETLYIAYIISWALCSAIHFICYLIIKKRITKKLNAEKSLEVSQ
ncbi:MAG: MATE family efflux transporter [Clostridia bacterium]|nr:MATE family efflux transporter [Clostridia bacterium]